MKRLRKKITARKRTCCSQSFRTNIGENKARELGNINIEVRPSWFPKSFCLKNLSRRYKQKQLSRLQLRSYDFFEEGL